MGFDRKKLDKEATFAEGLVRQFSDLFKPEQKEPSPEELEALQRQEESSEATAKALQSLRLQVLAGEEDEQGVPIRRAAPISVLQSKARTAPPRGGREGI
ncbi:unnamed protein product [Effrenium voratum]|nr:unnamed protein product [Effrenium voratum]